MPSITFNARYFLLTYSHIENGLDPFDVVAHFTRLGAECIVAKEVYPTGDGFHYHVYADFDRKFRSRRVDVFDVGGFHPNVEPSRGNPTAGFDYCIKDGDVVAGGLSRPEPGGSHVSTQEKWAEITSAATRDEFFELLEKLDPQRMVCNFTAIWKFADWRYKVEPNQYATPDGIFDFTDYPDIERWKASLSREPNGGESGQSVTPLCGTPPAPRSAQIGSWLCH